MTGDLFCQIGMITVCVGLIIECIGFVSTSRLQLYRAFTIQAVGFILFCGGVFLIAAARFLQ